MCFYMFVPLQTHMQPGIPHRDTEIQAVQRALHAAVAELQNVEATGPAVAGKWFIVSPMVQ